jgi:small subunit ribosomal protein S18
MFNKFRLKPDQKLLKKKARKKNIVVGAARRCRLCSDKEMQGSINYKNASFLKGFLTDSGKIISSRSAGTCHGCQKELCRAIKLSRTMALIPFCSH